MQSFSCWLAWFNSLFGTHKTRTQTDTDNSSIMYKIKRLKFLIPRKAYATPKYSPRTSSMNEYIARRSRNKTGNNDGSLSMKILQEDYGKSCIIVWTDDNTHKSPNRYTF